MLKHPISRLQELCQMGSYQEFGTEVIVTLSEKGEKATFKALGRTKEASKVNVAQAALDYISEHKPKLLESPASS